VYFFSNNIKAREGGATTIAKHPSHSIVDSLMKSFACSTLGSLDPAHSSDWLQQQELPVREQLGKPSEDIGKSSSQP